VAVAPPSSFDVLVIGSGASGLAAAVSAEWSGARVALAAKGSLQSCNSAKAQGGIQAAFGPDDSLYVAETMSGSIFRYPWENGRVVGRREVFGNVLEQFDPAVLQGPDGMKFGADGHLYAAVFGAGNVTVLDPRGKVSRRIRTEGMFPTNLVFGPPGSQTIYVTEVESGSVQIFDVGTDGLPLHL